MSSKIFRICPATDGLQKRVRIDHTQAPWFYIAHTMANGDLEIMYKCSIMWGVLISFSTYYFYRRISPPNLYDWLGSENFFGRAAKQRWTPVAEHLIPLIASMVAELPFPFAFQNGYSRFSWSPIHHRRISFCHLAIPCRYPVFVYFHPGIRRLVKARVET